MDDDTSYMAVKYYRDSDQKLDGYHESWDIFDFVDKKNFSRLISYINSVKLSW